MSLSGKHVAVIGAGLGGLSAALSCAAKGAAVEIYEKNGRIGGKLNASTREGYRFDLGPSILTLPAIFQELFARAGLRLEDHVPIRALDVHWRSFFEDGTRFDLVSDLERQKAIFAALDPEGPARFEGFLAYARRQYELSAGYLQGTDRPQGLLREMWGRGLLDLDLFRSMDRGVCRFFHHPRMRDVFNYFVKYVGSSPYRAPGLINLMPWVQYRYGLWYVEGGMHRLAEGIRSALEKVSVNIHLDTEVTGIDTEGKRATGVTLADGRSSRADVVISNMEVVPANERLLNAPLGPWARRRLEPACSGLVIHLGIRKVYPQLAHHNFFFSGNQKEHFASVFQRHVLPEDPTVYVVAPSRSDPSVAPPGCDNLKLLPHIPHLRKDHPCTPDDYAAFRDKVLAKCERMGLADLRKNIVVEETWTPSDIEQRYYANRGSIYGVVTDRFRNLAFKAAKKSRRYDNLYFVGGSVNPGPGMPMVASCGMQAADRIETDIGKGGNVP